jgi:hypothetical protein
MYDDSTRPPDEFGLRETFSLILGVLGWIPAAPELLHVLHILARPTPHSGDAMGWGMFEVGVLWPAALVGLALGARRTPTRGWCVLANSAPFVLGVVRLLTTGHC